MTEEIANPETGAMSEADAIASLMNRAAPPPEGKPAPEARQEAEPAQEPERAEPEADAPEPDEKPDATPRYKVKVAGEEVEATLDELLAGYSRQSDYQRKTQALAEERRQIEAERQRQKEITAQLVEVYRSAAQGQEQEPDWQKLADELDPWEFNKRRATWEVTKRAKAEAAQKAQELQERQRREIAATEAAKLREKVPEWADSKKFAADYKAMVDAATEAYGFEPSEVTSVLDHRTLLVLRDAIEMRRLRASKADAEKRVANPPKVLKPSAPPSKAEERASERDALRSKLKRTGKVDDAVAFLMARGN